MIPRVIEYLLEHKEYKKSQSMEIAKGKYYLGDFFNKFIRFIRG